MQSSINQSAVVLLLAAGVIGAVFVPWLSALFAPYALIALFLVMCFSLLSFAARLGLRVLSLDRTAWIIAAWQQILLPGIVLALGILGDIPEQIIGMMIVTVCAGSLFASPVLAGLLQLDRRRALQCMVLSTLATPVSLFVCLSLLHGSQVNLDFAHYVQRTLLFLVFPFVLLFGYRWISTLLPTRARINIEQGSHWCAVVALLVFGMGVVHPVSVNLHEQTAEIALYLFVATSLSIVMFCLSVIVMHRSGLKVALTAGIVSGLRNVGLSFALVGDMLGPDLGLYVGVSMLPIFIGPAIMHLVMVARQEQPDAVHA